MSSNSPAPIPGTLHVYDPSERLVYFESMPSSTSSAGCSSVIFIGGLGDGLAATPYLPPLAEALHGQGWSLIEVLTRSSYTGWGMGSVDRDVEDLHKLEGYLRRKDVKGGEAKLVLLGHSTGCQDIVRYHQVYSQNTWSACILQAGVSDREAWAADLSPEDLAASMQIAEAQMSADQGAYALPVKAMQLIYPLKNGQPAADGSVTALSANRWHSLAAKGGHEDYFSSDLTDEQMGEAFKGLRESGKRTLFAFGEKDGSVPDRVNKETLLQRFKLHAGEKGETVLLKDADHRINTEAPRREFVERVTRFVTGLA